MSDTRINTIKIKDLPESSTISDSDIVLKDNGIITHKFKLSTLIQYIKNHTEISKFFVHQSTVNSASGIAPLDLDKKIPTANIRYGKTAGTIYQGSEGAALETTINAHALDTSNPHDTTKSQIGLSNVPNVSTNDQTPTYAPSSTLSTLASGEKFSVSLGKIMKAITDLISHIANKNNPHASTKSQIGLSNVDNTQDINKPVSAAQRNAIDSAYENSNLYTDTKINALVNGAPETLDTLKEVSDAISKNKTVVDALNAAIGTKANQTELNTHTTNATIHITSGERTNYNDANTKKHTHGNKITIDKLSEADGILMFDGEQIQGGGSEYIHPKPTRANTTSSTTTTHGGTFSVLDVITSNAEGHVTSVNTKTITLPAAPTSVSGSSGSCSGTAAYANLINGVYTGNGGRQPPSYIPNGKIRWNMMNTTINNDATYKDFMLMDTYGGADVPYVTGLGISKNSGNPRAFLIVGNKNGSDWVGNEIITTTNTATKATNDAYGNEIINQKTSSSEPTNQKVGDYWVKEY